MQLISVNISEKVLNKIEQIVKEGYYPNRSETIRNMLNSFLEKDFKIKCPYCHSDIHMNKEKLSDEYIEQNHKNKELY